MRHGLGSTWYNRPALELHKAGVVRTIQRRLAVLAKKEFRHFKGDKRHEVRYEDVAAFRDPLFLARQREWPFTCLGKVFGTRAKAQHLQLKKPPARRTPLVRGKLTNRTILAHCKDPGRAPETKPNLKPPTDRRPRHVTKKISWPISPNF
ncbi:uncharacterized protein BCR38DRAFT_25554 [Pseudomassariella vexata]|uniref:Uncharacterized protein n=1 Tax=Pseudomassariella vexata TaxID=1141098 RepID=A0A1Y2EKE4_9PEZI|nr:uncharacterized protein BCR38DRAFT_25554 [Pseudomassariella vexata]ORY72019.1 hypothetical protein BCR38DRAFT_25554 [Pseudomassariella vexata]